MILRQLYRKCDRRFISVAVRRREDFKPVIGLEVHVQLNTQSKLFSRAPIGEDGGPNSRVVPFDIAIPGTLPLLNKKSVMHALTLAKLLNCQIPHRCTFDRKHYFYADMPAGYQITQSSNPIAKHGIFGFHVFSENIEPYWKEVDILQLQLEQDSGKTIHFGGKSLIDFNRAGASLVEVVTAPVFSSALEAVCFVQQLRLLLIHYGICEGELHKGHLRVDANVSLGEGDQMGVRTEVKNMNSIRHIHMAINYEINRHFELLSAGEKVINETRSCDAQGRTVSMRDKEVETDYRIMHEPNLPALKIKPEWLLECENKIQKSIPAYQQMINDGFDARSAIHFAETPLLYNFYLNCRSCAPIKPSLFISWLRELKSIMQRSNLVYPPQSTFFAKQFMEVISFHEDNRITHLTALNSMKLYAYETELRQFAEMAGEDKLWKLTNDEEIDAIIQKVIQQQAKLVDKVKRNPKHLSKLRAQVIEASNRRIDLDIAESKLRQQISANK